MLTLNKPYKIKNGDPIVFNGMSSYEIEYKSIDLYTSKEYDGQWNKKGQYMSNVYFLDRQATGLDIELE